MRGVGDGAESSFGPGFPSESDKVPESMSRPGSMWAQESKWAEKSESMLVPEAMSQQPVRPEGQ